MKFAIINAYSVRNIGDAGIVVATINLLREMYPNCEISVMSSTYEDNRSFYAKRNVASVPAVWQLTGSSLQRYRQGLSLFLRAKLGASLPKSEPIRDADLVISCGGGYLYSSRRGPYGVGFLAALFHIWLAKHFGKAVLVGPKSFGPITSEKDTKVLRAVLASPCQLIARERLSAKYLDEIGLKNYKLAPDIAFALKPSFEALKGMDLSKGAPKIGITVLDWRFANASATEEDIESYLEAIADACIELTKSHTEAHFYVFPQVSASKGVGGDCDVDVSERLSKLIGTNSTVIDIQAVSEPESVIGIYSAMDCFLASRMHSAIFALCAMVPTTALVYQSKTKGTFELLGLDSQYLDVVNLKSGPVLDKLKAALDDQEAAKKRLQTVVGDAKSNTIYAFESSISSLLGRTPERDRK
jgi:colanic acid/amylovoran biosynthesis protein